jgi:hypothetical protein
MAGPDDPSKDDPRAPVIRFPQSRVRLPGSSEPARELGTSSLVQSLGVVEQATGHWCSHCRGIWYGYLLEVACPVCGNRHG